MTASTKYIYIMPCFLLKNTSIIDGAKIYEIMLAWSYIFYVLIMYTYTGVYSAHSGQEQHHVYVHNWWLAHIGSIVGVILN